MELHCQSCSGFDSGRAEKSFAKGNAQPVLGCNFLKTSLKWQCSIFYSWTPPRRQALKNREASRGGRENILGSLIYFTGNIYRVNQCYYNVWGRLMYQKQFSYSINSSGLCSLLIYSAFQQYITKNMGLCGTGSYSGFKFIGTVRQVKEEENTLIPSIVPFSAS